MGPLTLLYQAELEYHRARIADDFARVHRPPARRREAAARPSRWSALRAARTWVRHAL